MRSLLIITFSFVLAQQGFSQFNFKKNLVEVKNIISRNLPRDAGQYKSSKGEYFLLDIYLDSITKKVKRVAVVSQDSALDISFVRHIADLIKQEWRPSASPYNRIIIPLLILVFKEEPYDDFLLELPLSAPKTKTNKTYILKTFVFEPAYPLRKNTN